MPILARGVVRGLPARQAWRRRSAKPRVHGEERKKMASVTMATYSNIDRRNA